MFMYVQPEYLKAKVEEFITNEEKWGIIFLNRPVNEEVCQTLVRKLENKLIPIDGSGKMSKLFCMVMTDDNKDWIFSYYAVSDAFIVDFIMYEHGNQEYGAECIRDYYSMEGRNDPDEAVKAAMDIVIESIVKFDKEVNGR